MGIEEATSTPPTVSNPAAEWAGPGADAASVAQLEQSGTTPLGGCNTKAGPQQQEGQRLRGIDR